MTGHAAVCIDDNLTAGQTCIALRTADNETAGGVDEILCIFIQKFSRDRCFDDLIDHVFFNLFMGYIRIVLGRNNHCIHTDRFPVIIFYGNLGLSIRTEERNFPVFSYFSQTACQTVSQCDRHGQVFRCFIGCIAEHHALVAGADIVFVGLLFLSFQRLVDTHGNIGGLFINGHIDAYAFTVKAVAGIGVADIINRFADDLGNGHIGAGGDFTENMHLPCGYNGFAGYTAIGILFQDGIKNGIGNLVGNLIRMSFCYGFRCK